MITNKYGFILPRYAQPTHYECIRGRYVAYYNSPKGEYGIMCEIKPSRKPEGKKVIGYSVFTKGEGVHYVKKCAKSQAAAFKYLKTVGVETRKKTVYTLLTNLTDGWENCYDDYLEWCDMNDIKPKGKNDSAFWKWVYDEIDYTIDDDLFNMEHSKIKDRMFVITGAIQRWDGRPTIKPVFVKGLVNTVKKVWGEGDRHFKIELDTEKGIITSRLWSHDDPMGNTNFEIRMLNLNGEKWLAAAEERGDEDEIEINNRWFSKIPDIGMIY